MQYQFIKEHTACYPIAELCDYFGLSRSGYYAWLVREPSTRAREDAVLKERIDAVYTQSKQRYGYLPIYHLLDECRDCGRDRTLCLMNEMGISGTQKKRFKPVCTDSNHDFGYRPILLRDLSKPDRPEQVWVADTTYLRTREGWSFLATVMGLFSRRVIGWSVSNHNDSKLVCQALQSAILTRGGDLPPRLIRHSDRGGTYASYEYQDLLQCHAILQRMSAKGNCYGNAAMESFFGRYKTSSAVEVVFADQTQARANAFEYIEVFYNQFRKHASLNHKNPTQFEENVCPHGGKHPSLLACINHN